MKKMMKAVLIIIVMIVAVLILMIKLGTKSEAVPSNYAESTSTGGELEKEYLATGEYKVAHVEGDFPKESDSDWKSYVIYYPKELDKSDYKYPVVVSCNGTGVPASRYPDLLEHLASWGFIVLGNEDPNTAPGDSAKVTLDILLALNEDQNSIFYQKVDTENIGIYGHSQGAHAVFNCIQNTDVFKTAVALSPSDAEHAESNKMPYEYESTNISLLLLAGSGMDAIDLDNMNIMYEKLNCPRLFARKTGINHGEMLYSADGYVTAWFCWQLQENENAAKIFLGENPEIFSNGLYQDQKSELQ